MLWDTLWAEVTFLLSVCFIFIFCKLIYFNWKLITGFCHTLTWISHGCTYVHHHEPPSHLPLHLIPHGHLSAPALSALSHALNLDWQSISHMAIYMFQCYSLKPSHPRPLPQSPKVCSLHLCLFCCLSYRVIIAKFHICVNILYWCFSFWFTSLCIIGSSFIHLFRTDSF